MLEVLHGSMKKCIFIGGWAVSVSLTLYICMLLPLKVCKSYLLNFTILLAGVAVAGFIGVALESRISGKRLSALVKPLLRFTVRPDVAGRAWLLSLFSGTAASVMLAEAGKSGRISRREMYLSVLASRFPAMLSSSLRIIFPIIAAIGIIGVYYYLMVYGIEFVIFLMVILYARLTQRGTNNCESDFSGRIKGQTGREVWLKSLKTAGGLCLRFVKIALPCYLLTALALRSGIQDELSECIPEFCRCRISPDMLPIAGARLGGMFSAVGVVAEVTGSQSLSVPEIVFSLLLGKIIMTPVRMLRTGIPVMTGIFKFYDGMRLAFTISTIRLLISLIAALIIYMVLL